MTMFDVPLICVTAYEQLSYYNFGIIIEKIAKCPINDKF